MIVNTSKKSKTKIVVLKPQIDSLDVQEIFTKQKTKPFRRFLKSPDANDVHVDSFVLIYEPLMILSGLYEADFLQKSTHELKVDSNVKEILFGGGIFPASNYVADEGFASKLKKNTVQLPLEEHVFVTEEKELVLDQHGESRNFTYKVNAQEVENYPKQILEKNNVKEIEITEQLAIKKLAKTLQYHDKFDDVRDLNESLVINEITIVYIPIYETRLIGPKKKIEILRFDAVKKKLL